jgi:hypothetical protein
MEFPCIDQDDNVDVSVQGNNSITHNDCVNNTCYKLSAAVWLGKAQDDYNDVTAGRQQQPYINLGPHTHHAVVVRQQHHTQLRTSSNPSLCQQYCYY